MCLRVFQPECVYKICVYKKKMCICQTRAMITLDFESLFGIVYRIQLSGIQRRLIWSYKCRDPEIRSRQDLAKIPRTMA